MDFFQTGVFRPPTVPDPNGPWAQTHPRTSIPSGDAAAAASEEQEMGTRESGATGEHGQTVSAITLTASAEGSGGSAAAPDGAVPGIVEVDLLSTPSVSEGEKAHMGRRRQ